MVEDLTALIRKLRAKGGDSTDVEVKAAAGGLPDSLGPTLSAFANLPGGGTIILGLDERHNFQPVQLSDIQKLKQGLAAKARCFEPPVGLSIDDGLVDGAPVVVAHVRECDSSSKPCRLAATGKAYLRVYDGDYELSDLEAQAFLRQRQQPHFDIKPVPNSTIDDLDAELAEQWLATVRSNDPHGLGRFADDNELLRRAGVITTDGELTVAGLLVLGAFPQQWFPRYVIQIAAFARSGDPAGARARNQQTITGPISRMLDESMAWARQNFDTFIVGGSDGVVRDQWEYPLDAFRELVVNSLIHRDLDNWSEGKAVEIRLFADRLVIDNPGGLYGITVNRLGKEPVTSARNARLVTLCQYLRSSENSRMIEALATGIPTISAALAGIGYPPAQFVDSGIRFTAILRKTNGNTSSQQENIDLAPNEETIYQALMAESLTVPELKSQLGLADHTIRRGLRTLRDRGYVEQQGGRGKRTLYRIRKTD